MKAPPERLGSFYLGAEYDLSSGQVVNQPLNYDARDLTTHAICVGMTGSGKTGLCVCLLEEAAIDRVPAILIDPKGDITNLLLQFPGLRSVDFLPWVNPDDARRRGMTVEEYAEHVADLWRKGLSEWGIQPDRIQKLRDSADFTIYTPGSTSGLPVSILSSLAAPRLDFEQNNEMFRERINSIVAALLSLIGLKVDPVRSREAILLSNIFEHYWRQYEDLNIQKLIDAVQTPPIRKLGVFDLDNFYPPQDRFELAMRLNSLVASPSFQSWMQGEPIDIDHLLYTASGQPRHSIFYIAHLSDQERMFFVTLLLENLVMWARSQTGTTSLRALVYFDEVFGYFPPVAEPPSKRPLLTLLKQARAFGLGVVLVTQNPVDIDYKGLTNAGTWFIGKLQTDRDKARVLQGLKGAIATAGGNSENLDYDDLINGLRSRVFLMHNVHEDRPVIFHSRWAISYLRGPLTRPQVHQLMKVRKSTRPSPPIAPSLPLPTLPSSYFSTPPALDPSLDQVYLPLELHEKDAIASFTQQGNQADGIDRIQLVYQPAVLGGVTIRFLNRKRSIDTRIHQIYLTWETDPVRRDWADAELLPIRLQALERAPAFIDPDKGPFYEAVPKEFSSTRNIKRVSKSLADWLYHNSRLHIQAHQQLKVYQQPDESDRDFLIRLQQAAREQRDREVDKLEHKNERRLDRLETKLRKLERELIADESEYKARQREELVGVGETVLSFFLGRRRTSAATTIARRRRMTSKIQLDIEETKEEITDLQADITELEHELKDATADIVEKWEQVTDQLQTEPLKPRRTDVTLQLMALAWMPFWLITYNNGRFTQTLQFAAYKKS